MEVMKQRSTTPVSNGFATKAISVAVAVLSIVAVPMTMTQRTYADKYDDQIRAIQGQIDSYQAQASELSKQGDSLQNQIDILSAQKASIQAQLDASQTKYDKLQADIAATETKIAGNKEALGETIAQMYVSGTISPLEMLASSNNISDYVDQQTARSSITDAIGQKITEIKALKKQLEAQKVDVERVLTDQKNSRDALAAKEAEQAALLAQTRDQEASYQQLSSQKQAEKAQVQQAQQAAIAAAIAAASRRSTGGGGGGASFTISAGDGSMGGYPWAGGCYVDANAWSHGGAGGNGEDPLGYGCRQCVSYTAWKMYQKTGYAPRYWGNANMWPGSARSAGFSVGHTPRANSLAVISAGAYGHIVYVEGYNPSNGTVRVSQFNYYNAGGPGWGNYSEMTLPAGTYDTYIYL